MASLQRRSSVEAARVTITWSMNQHDAMTVTVVEDDADRQVVDYGSPAVRDTLEQLPAGTTVEVEMVPIETRGNLWRIVDI